MPDLSAKGSREGILESLDSPPTLLRLEFDIRRPVETPSDGFFWREQPKTTVPNIAACDLPIDQRNSFHLNTRLTYRRAKAGLERAAFKKLPNLQLTELTYAFWHFWNLMFEAIGMQPLPRSSSLRLHVRAGRPVRLRITVHLLRTLQTCSWRPDQPELGSRPTSVASPRSTRSRQLRRSVCSASSRNPGSALRSDR